MDNCLHSDIGDPERAKSDAWYLNEVWLRQGTGFTIKCLADSIAKSSDKLKLTAFERKQLRSSLLVEFFEALAEKI